MKSISVYDLKLIPELAHLSIFDLVHPDNDALVNPFLAEMGFDLDYPLMYTVSQHRTLQHKVEIGFVIRGETNINRKHVTGPWGTLDDRLAAAAITDPSLCAALCEQMNTGLDYGSFSDNDDGPESFPDSMCDPHEQQILTQIKQLEGVLLAIRGNQHKNDGSLKLAHEYHIVEEPIKQRKRHTKRAKLLT